MLSSKCYGSTSKRAYLKIWIHNHMEPMKQTELGCENLRQLNRRGSVLVSHCCCNQLSGLNQYKFIILLFCRWEIQNQFHWARIKVSARLYFYMETLGNNMDSCPFRFLEVTHNSWLVILFHHRSLQSPVQSFSLNSPYFHI